MNEALGRLRRERPAMDLDTFEAQRTEAQIIKFLKRDIRRSGTNNGAAGNSTACRASDRQAARDLSNCVHDTRDRRMSVEETAELLGLQPETVKTRLHRARRLVLRNLTSKSARPDGRVSVRRQALRARDQRRSATAHPSRVISELFNSPII